MRFFARLLLLAVIPAALTSAAFAQGWKPTKDVEFVIPFGLGGGADLMARVIHKVIVDEKLVPVSIALVNKPGARARAAPAYRSQWLRRSRAPRGGGAGAPGAAGPPAEERRLA